MPKSIYLNDSVLKQLNNIKKLFNEYKYEPDDIGIIAAALTIYNEWIIEKKKQDSIELIGYSQGIEKTKTDQK